MKWAAFVSFVCIAAMTVSANSQERPSISNIAKTPKEFIGRSIEIRGASCVDDPKGAFLCRVTAGSHTLRIEAGGLGMAGGDVVAERLIGPCKGRDKLGAAACRFDVVIKPTSAQSEAVIAEFEGDRVTRLYSNIIDMRLPGRR